jgi:hypothetical protein
MKRALDKCYEVGVRVKRMFAPYIPELPDDILVSIMMARFTLMQQDVWNNHPREKTGDYPITVRFGVLKETREYVVWCRNGTLKKEIITQRYDWNNDRLHTHIDEYNVRFKSFWLNKRRRGRA